MERLHKEIIKLGIDSRILPSVSMKGELRMGLKAA